jgi:MerR family transcriptional regulator, thiopeptide resistance regulator
VDAEDYTVGAVAQLTGVSVRTLHHYDEVGLLQPSGRTAAGYRLYSPADLQRLQRVLFYRELGFGLDVIAVIVDDPGSTDGELLRRQRQLLVARIERCQAMVAAIDKELFARKVGISLTPHERLEAFGSTRLDDLADEADRRFGADAEWAQQRTSGYTVRDWENLLAESGSIHQRLLDAMNDGVPAGDAAAMDLAEEHRQHTDRWYHDCGPETHRQYAEEHLAHGDHMTPGLGRYIHDAIIANCDRAADGQEHSASNPG